MDSLLDAETPESLHHIVSKECNTLCADCYASEPEWASLAFGTIVCLQCAGYHRSLGTHITTVRSLKLDAWSDVQIKVLEFGGNESFLKHIQLHSQQKSISCSHIHSSLNKYFIPEVLFYREILEAQTQMRDPASFDEAYWVKLSHQIIASLGSSILSSSNDTADSNSKPFCELCEQYLYPASLHMLLSHNNNSQVVTSTTSTSSSLKSNANKLPQPWLPDNSAVACMICSRDFSVMVRKHHCRKCGRVICKDCAPVNNTRPIFEMGFREPVRHCKDCYRSPLVKWKTTDG